MKVKTKSVTGLSVTDVSGAEVDDDVGDEHDVDKYVDNKKWVQGLQLRDVGRSRLGCSHQSVVGRRLYTCAALA